MYPFSSISARPGIRLGLVALLIGAGVGVGVALTTPALAADETCFATPDNGTTVYSNTTAQAVRDAVSAAPNGGTVKMAGNCPGTQMQDGTAQVVLITKTLTLAGGYHVNNWATAYPITQPTVLDAQGAGRVISTTAVPVTLQGFTATNGQAAGEGGGLALGGAATLAHMTVYNNTAAGFSLAGGGGAYCVGPATVMASTFISNTAHRGGGAYFSGPAYVTGTTFANNQATAGGGGANFGFAHTIDVAHTTFSANSADYGGGLAFLGSEAFLTNTTFLNNSARLGGGMYFMNTVVLTMRDSALIGNTATEYGGGGHFTGGPLTQHPTPRATKAAADSQPCTTAGGVCLTNVLLARNQAPHGAALHTYAQAFWLRHLTLVGPGTPGTAALEFEDSQAHITNTLIASYTVGIHHLANAVSQYLGTVTEDHTLFSGVATPYSRTAVAALIHGGHSITGTAAFVAPDLNNYHLAPGSAGINLGTNAGVTTDMDGEPRPQNGGYDIGYDEVSFYFKRYLPLLNK